MANYDVTNVITGQVVNSLTDWEIDDVKLLRWYIPGTTKEGEYDLEHGIPSDPAFTVDADGTFEHSFDTVGLKGTIGFVVEAYDYHNHKSEFAVQLLDNRPGPEIQILDPHPPPVYSSSVHTTITVKGLVSKLELDEEEMRFVAKGLYSGQYGEKIDPDTTWPLPFPDPNYAWFQFSFDPYDRNISGDMTIEITAYDTAGRDSSHKIEIEDDSDPPTITVDSLQTNDSTPQLSGTLDEQPTSVTIRVAGRSYSGASVQIGGSGSNWTWTVYVTSPIVDGTYDIEAEATDALGNTGSDSTNDELTIDTTAPAITVDSLRTNDTRPELTGTIDDDAASITINVGGNNYSGSTIQIGGSGPVWTWTLPDDVISTALAEGTHNVQAQATDSFGNTGYDGTTGELTIDTTAWVTVDSLTTDIKSPELTGKTEADIASISVTVGGSTYSGSDVQIDFVSPDWVWTLAAGTISPDLSPNTYDVDVDVVDTLGNTGSDGTTNELTILN
jgi:hypothetical protein